MSSFQTGGAPSASAEWFARYRRFISPKSDNLPRVRVLLALPALLVLVGIVLVALGINGSSSGVFHDQISYGSDPDLIAGQPQATRSDEWNVQTVWAIAQVEQGLPLTNETFPGGMDATLPQDLPRVDWTVAFRPHLWGFMVMDVDHAIAFKWWLPGLALIAAAYVFLVSVIPRRPIVVAMISVGFFFSPLFQWWYLSTTLWPAVWALTSMAALVWAFKSSSVASRWIWASIVGYLTVVMATGIYVPFIVPAVLVVVFFAVGQLVDHLRQRPFRGGVFKRIAPLLAGGLVASAVTGLWLYSKRTVVDAFLGTAYPGDRSSPPGMGDLPSFMSAVGSSFTQSLNDQRAGLLGANSSEASTFFYIGIFLLPVVIWIIAREMKAKRSVPWTLVGLIFVVVLFLAYLFLPGWDGLSKLLLLDKTTGNRVRLGMGLASIGLLAYVVSYLDKYRLRAGWWLAIIPAGLFLASQLLIGYVALRGLPAMLETAQLWWVWATLSAASIFFFARRKPRLGAAAFLIVTVAGSGLTNPVYRGVLDLRETDVSQAIMAIDEANPQTWVGVGSGLTTAMLLESGVRAYNGFQGAPSQQMWSAIDPADAYEFEWNRLAGVSWTAAPGEPVVSNPAADQISVTFDACSQFAQENIQYVLSTDQRIDHACLSTESGFDLPKSQMFIYKVVPNS
ncbi:hypothetical protein [Cryobacterium sp. Hh38]|uniref:DUF7657 domain-containing protein n=1 Tax=Cryobacterium sp. Hh38 TaxID=1259156 RepID=UPI001104CD85|nr:hypothetical protein [Cryobacterium sp. Hh38]TFD57546.1 hypothetical protein E3T41_13185 [Cryobacterium sp. Hh38]